METYRQGDVLLLRVPKGSLPHTSLVVRPKSDRVILAYGEVTGHHHHIVDRAKRPRARLYEVPASSDRLLTLAEAMELLHEEHSEIKLPAGDYLVRIQREYHPEELRYVLD